MAEFSGPFDGSPIATQEQWSGMARRWGLDGVHAVDASNVSLSVNGSGTTTVAVSPGRAFVNGYYYQNSSTKNLTVTTNAGTSARVDLVVLRADPLSAKAVTAVYKTGGATPPTLQQDDDGIWEIPLAQCTVAAGSSVVTAANTLDRRWFTDRGAVPSVPGARRPSSRGQLLVEGTSLYVGDGADWRLLGSPVVEDATYTPVWTTGTTTINWGSGTLNMGRYQLHGKRVDVLIHLLVGGNPPLYEDPIMVSLPPGLPAATLHRSPGFTWHFTSGNAEGIGIGTGVIYPSTSTTKIARLLYSMTGSTSITTPPTVYPIKTNEPWNIRTGDILTIDGSYWIA